jgi:hypothetical protein
MQLLKILSAVALLSQAILAGPRIQRTMATAPVSSVPNPVALLCGLHGLNLFLVQFDYVPSGVAVTLENYYELCLVNLFLRCPQKSFPIPSIYY